MEYYTVGKYSPTIELHACMYVGVQACINTQGEYAMY